MTTENTPFVYNVLFYSSGNKAKLRPRNAGISPKAEQMMYIKTLTIAKLSHRKRLQRGSFLVDGVGVVTI